MQEKKLKNQLITLENRNLFSMTGITDVESSGESSVKLNTTAGKLIINGSNLNISKINVDTGELAMSGTIDKIEYKSASSKKKLSSLFR